MFVDTSVVVAILSGEADADEFIARLEEATNPVTSGIVVLEAVMRLSTKLRVESGDAEEAVSRLLSEAGITIEPIGAGEAAAAVRAFTNYGKGRGHPAQLHLADCLTYACAKARGLPILYKGEDFAQTDLA